MILGISADTSQAQKKFEDKHDLPYTLLADTDKKVAKAYGVADDNSRVASRVTFVIDKEGRIAYVNPKVNPATHAAELRTVLNTMTP